MLSAKLKAKADNTYQDLDYLVYTTKTESNNSFIIHGFEENDDKHTIARSLNNIGVVIGNHALRMQPTD